LCGKKGQQKTLFDSWLANFWGKLGKSKPEWKKTDDRVDLVNIEEQKRKKLLSSRL